MHSTSTIVRVAMPVRHPVGHLAWFDELAVLANKFSHLGVGPDLDSLTFDEAWAVYRHLSHAADGRSL